MRTPSSPDDPDAVGSGGTSGSLRQFSGIERAAVLLMLIDADEAAALLRQLAPEEVQELGAAMVAVAHIDEAEITQLLGDCARTPTDDGFALRNGSRAAKIAAQIAAEHPQVAAVLLAHLDLDMAALVLEHLPEAVRPEVLRRVARLAPVPPEALATLKAMLDHSAARRFRPLRFPPDRHNSSGNPHPPHPVGAIDTRLRQKIVAR